MAVKPTAPDGDYVLRKEIYGADSVYDVMSTSEFIQGRNNTGEVETPLGSVPNSHKENWYLSYLNRHIVYLTEMVEYLDSKIV